MSLDYAKPSYTVDWKTWLKRRLYINDLRVEKGTPLSSLFYEAFIETYEADGLDISDGTPVTAPDISEAAKHSSTLTKIFSCFITFIGLPDRLQWFEADASNKRKKNIHYYGMSLIQLGKNLIGGWDSRSDISKEKKVWQYVSLPFKIFVVLPIKLITFPLKLVLNILKLFTEYLPLLISKLIARSIVSVKSVLESSERNYSHTGAYKPLENRDHNPSEDFLPKEIPVYVLASGFKYWLVTVGLLISIFALGALHYAFRIINLLGRAVTSPAKSIRMAFAFGRELNGKFTGTLVGLLLAGLSLTITTALWFIALPLSISAIATYIPVLFQAITWVTHLPIVVNFVSWLQQIPLLMTSAGMINGVLSSLGLTLTTIFGPVLSSLAGFVGVKLSLDLMLITSALCVIAAPLCVSFSLINDKLSNLWATWQNSGPFTKLFSFFNRSKNKSDTDDESEFLLRSESDNGVPLEPSSKLRGLTDQLNEDISQSEDSDELATQKAQAAHSAIHQRPMKKPIRKPAELQRPPIVTDPTARRMRSN